jgi:hypothetical protein
MPMPIAIQLLHTRIEHYFATENRRDYTYPGPNGSRNALAMHLMAMILTLQKSDRGFFKSLEQDESLSQAFSNLCFMHALVLYEEVAAVCIRNSHPSTAERGKIISDLLICNSSMKRADFFYKGCKDVEANSQYTQLQKQLIRNIYILRSTYEPQYMGFKELAAHVARKNVLSAKRKNNYHAQLIYNLDIHRQCKADSVVVQSLIDAMKNIKTGEQPRTQFIIDVIGNGHGLLTDVSFNQETCEFEIVCVDPI